MLIGDDEMRQRRVQELFVGASSFGPMSGVLSIIDGADKVVNVTTKGVIHRDVSTTNGDPNTDPLGYVKQNPLAC